MVTGLLDTRCYNRFQSSLDHQNGMTQSEQQNHIVPLAVPLTDREQEILGLVGQGRTNQQIADELVVAHSTVRWYLRQIYAKLGVEGRDEAAARARDMGLAANTAFLQSWAGNLPTPPTPFLGRQGELGVLGGLLSEAHVRLVTIMGPGGIGKTRLALTLAERQVARRVSGNDKLLFPDGVWYVSGAAVETLSELILELAAVLGLVAGGAGGVGRAPEKLVLEFLRRKRLLLVLDNLEHLPQSAPFLADIIATAPQVKVLVTSRERLHLRAEQLFLLSGLDLPSGPDAAGAASAGAVRLFIETAQRVQPALALDEAALAAVVRVCTLLEGMPLAIEHAASWAGVLPVAAIEQEVRNGLAILTADLADLPARQRSMQAMLDVSWAKLQVEEQNLLAMLSVFSEGFTQEAAVAAAGATLPLLRSLSDKSWLTYEQAQDRYHTHALIRQYASEQGRVLGSDDTARRRHLEYYVNFAKRAEQELRGSMQSAWMRRLQTERDNIRAALQWGQVHDREAAAQLASALYAYWFYVGHIREASDHFQRLSDARRNWPASLRMRFCIGYGTMALAQRDFSLCEPLAEEVMQVALELEDDEGVATALRGFGTMAHIRGDFATAVSRFEEALDLARRVPDLWAARGILQSLVESCLALKQYQRAQRFATEALELCRRYGDVQREAYLLLQLGTIALQQAEYADARRWLEDALAAARLIHNRVIVATVFRYLGETAFAENHLSEARDYLESSLRLYQEYGHDFAAATVREQLSAFDKKAGGEPGK